MSKLEIRSRYNRYTTEFINSSAEINKINEVWSGKKL